MLANSKQPTGPSGRGKKGHRRGRRPRRGAAAGKSTIHEFATCDSCEALLRCIHAGADVAAADAAGLSPLMHAVLSAKVNNVLALLEYGAPVNETAVLTEDSIVHHAANRYTEDFSLLFWNHRRTLAGVRVPVTPLHLACMRGDFPLIYALLANGANPNSAVQGPLSELCGKPADFFSRFSGQKYPQGFPVERETTLDFLSDHVEDMDERVFRIYLHKSGMLSASSRATCVSQVRKCETLLHRDLFGNAEDDLAQLSERLVQESPGFSGIQKGGVARSLNRFIEYVKSSMHCKYNSLEALSVL